MATLAVNKRAKFDYQILETYEAGIVLSGQEVKSVKTGHISLKGSFVTAKGGEFYLTNADIPPYKFAGQIKNYSNTRPRKLLLKKSEIRSLMGKIKAQGLTMVPLRVYTKRQLVKVEFALAKGKKKHDKRQDLAKKDAQGKIERAMKYQ